MFAKFCDTFVNDSLCQQKRLKIQARVMRPASPPAEMSWNDGSFGPVNELANGRPGGNSPSLTMPSRLRGRLAGDGRQALQRDGQVAAGDLDLVLLEQVQAVGPILHHHATLLDVLGVVVSRADLVRVGVRELGIHFFG
jgi:hypothetical protein